MYVLIYVLDIHTDTYTYIGVLHPDHGRLRQRARQPRRPLRRRLRPHSRHHFFWRERGQRRELPRGRLRQRVLRARARAVGAGRLRVPGIDIHILHIVYIYMYISRTWRRCWGRTGTR